MKSHPIIILQEIVLVVAMYGLVVLVLLVFLFSAFVAGKELQMAFEGIRNMVKR